MKRNIIIGIVLVGLLLSACGPAATTAAPTQPPAATAEPTQEAPTAEPTTAEAVTISYAIWDNNQLPVHQEIIKAFEAKNPNIHVEPQVVPWGDYWNKLQTAVAGGEAYDVFWMNGPNAQVYASKGVMLDLQPIVDEGAVDTSVYPESLVNLYSYDGHLYGLPKDFDTIGLFYNKDLFDAAELDYPNENWTWDDLSAAAKTLTKDTDGDGKVDQWGYASTTESQIGYWNLIFENGGQVIAPDGSKVLIDEPAACDAIKYAYSFVEDGSSPDGATLSSSDPWGQLFPGGKIAMIMAGSWMSKTYNDAEPNIDVAPLPKSKQQATVIHGLANVVWSGSKHQAEAVEFVKFLGSKDAEQILAESGVVIPAYKGLQDTWVKALPDMHLQVFIDGLSYSVPYPSAAKGMEWSTKIQEVLNETWIGNVPIDEACAKAAEEANAVLQSQ